MDGTGREIPANGGATMNDMKRMKCPMCEQTFINPNELNRHKRACPAKDD